MGCAIPARREPGALPRPVAALFMHRGRIGTQWVEREIGAVMYTRDEKVHRVYAFFSWDEALERAGLDPREGSDRA